MIENDAQLDQANEVLAGLERAVRALRARVHERNPALFAAMAEDYGRNIARIRAEVDQYLGIAVPAEQDAPLLMVLEGEAVSGRDISARLLSDWLDRFRKALYGVTAYLEKGTVRVGGSPDPAILAATDPHVLAVAPGSIRVALRLPEGEPQLDLFTAVEPAKPPPQQALDQLFDVARWAASDDLQPPIRDAGDVDQLTVAARFAAELAPSANGAVRAVTFSGPLVPQPERLRLTPESRDRLHGLVRLLSKTSDETIHGQLREIDLDKKRVIVRERGPGVSDIKCVLTAELLAKAESLLGKRIVARGVISSARPDTMHAQSIDRDE